MSEILAVAKYIGASGATIGVAGAGAGIENHADTHAKSVRNLQQYKKLYQPTTSYIIIA